MTLSDGQMGETGRFVPMVDEGWAVVHDVTGDPVWIGRWPTEDGARMHLRRIQRDMNRQGYNPESEHLTTAYFGSSGTPAAQRSTEAGQ